jgi:hypothetical protein
MVDPTPDMRAARLRAAARRVVHLHPGPVGELLARELCVYADFGHRFGPDGVLDRLAADVLGADAPVAHTGATGRDGAGPDAPGAGAAPRGGDRPALRLLAPPT